MPIPRFVPEPVELLDVVGVGVGVGVSQTRGPTTITLLSIERYREGFILLFRFLHEERHRPRTFVVPELDWSVLDRRGTLYTVGPAGGGGGGFQFRYAYRGAPALPQEASEIIIEAPQVGWRRLDGDKGVRSNEADAGPWRFVVAAPPSSGRS